VRGLINLYYNNFIFSRVPRGIADLEQALAMTTADSPPALILRVRTALGDGYSGLETPPKHVMCGRLPRSSSRRMPA
jgi:hypothetical protein